MSRAKHLVTEKQIKDWPEFTPERPLKILVSGCLNHQKTLTDGTSYDLDYIHSLLALPNVSTVTFCPENYAVGTPRDIPDIHGGNGFDVIDGGAKVLTDKNADLTEKMLGAAHEMLRLAKANEVHLALLVDMSASCGVQVISDGCRMVENRKFQKGPGVCAALLSRHGFPTLAQRDFKTLEHIRCKLDKKHVFDEEARDHHETEWFLENLS